MSSIRKIGLLAGITGLFFAMASGTGYAATLSITDLTDSDPLVSTDLVLSCTGCGVTPSPEGAQILAQYSVADGGLIFPGSRSVQLLEPDGVTISDTITLNVVILSEATESIDVTFTSDTEGSPLAPLPGAVLILEDGTSQDLTVALNSGGLPGTGGTGMGLQIFVQSDLDPAAVPEPATLLLLGSGLAGLAGWQRTKWGQSPFS